MGVLGTALQAQTRVPALLLALLGMLLGKPAEAQTPPPPFPLVGSQAASGNPHGDIAIACERCHTSRGWDTLRDPLEFDHDRDTPFVLAGRHSQAACRSCHVGLRFDGPDLTPDACGSCHLDVHRGQLGTNCEQCHTTEAFGQLRGVEIHAQTAFPLTGAHLQVSCASCHGDDVDGAFRPLDPSCFGCHADDYHATVAGAVDHAAAGFPTTCETCHNTVSFSGGGAFDHAAVSGGFALLGAHATAPCSACHAADDLTPLFEAADESECFACHEADYEATAANALVDHAAAGFSTDCQECHTPETWEGAAFDHEGVTGFPLLGAHLAVDCATCHSGPSFSVPGDPAGSGDCVACHEADHAEAHPAFPTTCADCHTVESFQGAVFDHAEVSDGFHLVGAHVALPCEACHTGPDFAPIWDPAGDDDCLACHTEDHQEAHPSFPTACTECHTTDSFAGATFDHGERTGFELLGIHESLDCATCHEGPDFTPIFEPSSEDDCATCHADDHAEAHPGFPTTCAECHNTTTFAGTTFDHQEATGFPLLGAHVSLECAACHTIPDFGLIHDPDGPDDCVTCHEADHQAAHPSFPTACAECHSTDSFAGATFDHGEQTGFPLAGAHVTLDCAACHTIPDFGLINTPSGPDDCFSCHEADHEQAHPSFPITCADCHSTESFAGVTFDHGQQTGFELVGAHVTLDCAACHTLPDFGLIDTPSGQDDCFACHEADHQAAHIPFPTTCLDCHNTTTFGGGTFDHEQVTGFPLVGVHEGLACATCHEEGPDYTPLYNPSGPDDCYTCHEADHQAAHSAFPTTCLDCHQPNTWAGATFEHEQATGFPLVGAHVSLACAACHTLPDFGLIHDPDGPDDCFACHEADHAQAHAPFPTTCLDCHTTTTFTGATFDHQQVTGFALLGAHQALECAACHTIPDFGLINTPSGQDDCFACHEQDHQAAHASFPTTCTDCHTNTTFAGATFDHGDQTGFPLVGAHVTLDCSACHTIPDFGLIHDPNGPDDCFACHEPDHQAAHPSFPTTCADCHTTTTFAGATFNHAQATGFPLVGVHRTLDCAACHSLPDFTPLFNPDGPDDCYTCHEADHQAAHSAFPTTCLDCHQPNTWAGATFDHGQATGFQLVGAHVTLDCAACHTIPDFGLINTPSGQDDCFACHEADHAQAHAPFPTTCLDCHTTATFQGATFDHQQATGFALLGAHESLECAACHTIPDFGLIHDPNGPDDCFACHEADHQAAHASFPTTCADCHTTTTFQGATFNHQQATGFPLVGVHQSLGCAACHTLPDFGLINTPSGPDDCFACHGEDHQAAHPPFPTTCLDCHQPNTWAGATFDHGQATGFVLVGAHQSLDCAACHTLPDFGLINTPSNQNDCFACHEADHQAAHAPFPTTCLDCHNTSTFTGATFNHGQATGFPLVGAHTSLDCSSCHTLPDFGLIHNPNGPDDCFTCHEADHQAAHPSFPTTCGDCHNTTTFQGATFNHGQATGFPLFGAHQALDCSACHTLPDFGLIHDPNGPDDCFACHEADHQAAHPSFPTTCRDCHTTTTFQGATFDHGQATGFQLVGAHTVLDCAACHTLPDFGLINTPSNQNDCFACHEEDHQAAHPPFPTTCLDCHTTTTFQGATFDHQQATGFPLVGAHTSLPCTACHTVPDFGLIHDPDGPDDCYACHAEDHEEAHPPFPTTCLDCHTTTTFQGATFDHQQATGFPLVGVHTSLPCSACHSIPDFTPLFDPSGPNDCYECHQDEYQQAHPGFPRTCLDCHQPNTWANPTFEHDQFFPIYSGRHEGEWNSCQQCHPQPGNFQVFSCITCHEHRRGEMDDEHEDVGGYVYQSQACFNCHPRGNAN